MAPTCLREPFSNTLLGKPETTPSLKENIKRFITIVKFTLFMVQVKNNISLYFL